jgi:hypothetical protein
VLHPHPVVMPDLRHVVRHALPNLVEGKLVPVALFVVFLELLGNVPALLIALAWSLGSLSVRRLTGRTVSGLIVLSAVALAARTIAAIATGSMLVYFLQPTITTVFVGIAFLASVRMGTPLAQKLAFDLLPFDDATKDHPLVRQFFVRLSVFWALTSLVNAAITLWLLLTASTTTFVLVKSVLGPATAIVTIGTMLVWLRLAVRRTGTQIVWTRRTPALALA